MGGKGNSRRKAPRVRRAKEEKHSIPVNYQGKELRSLLEQHFVVQLEDRGIKWEYEPERISGAKYLVDFYLPELKTWVEVKGYFDSREDLLLPFVAGHLHRERGERLFLNLARETYLVRSREYERLTTDAFWENLQNQPADAGKPSLGGIRPLNRRPWDRR